MEHKTDVESFNRKAEDIDFQKIVGRSVPIGKVRPTKYSPPSEVYHWALVEAVDYTEGRGGGILRYALPNGLYNFRTVDFWSDDIVTTQDFRENPLKFVKKDKDMIL